MTLTIYEQNKNLRAKLHAIILLHEQILDIERSDKK